MSSELKTIIVSVLVTLLILTVSLLMIFREKFPKRVRDKYMSYYKIKDPFIAWVFLLPVGIISLFTTIKQIIDYLGW